MWQKRMKKIIVWKPLGQMTFVVLPENLPHPVTVTGMFMFWHMLVTAFGLSGVAC